MMKKEKTKQKVLGGIPLPPPSAADAGGNQWMQVARCGFPVASEYHILPGSACTNPAFFLNRSDILRANLANYNKVYYFIGRRKW
ncbi:MAG: hypothetical protein JJO53_03805 [Escherichia coli]|jgi:hypothetical protein|uniref:hypothetical protein n=1 Tax=Faecalibacterium sp. TaxID=1971605 RepID=UPI001A546F53|nr:hypothetical protein [Escherichia coli]MBL1022263.1 hypothetical protein [Escherichia coli]MBL1037770.1 hypothetical protein [Escherichia coli]MBL1042457.1 hypothetical protein [Escherichia coli]